jgi:hypothetical protein
MSKITQYYLNKASYIAIDENGQKIDIDIDYWGGKFRVSNNNRVLRDYAAKLLKKKHRVNYVFKIAESQ